MTEITRVPLQPIAKGSTTRIWVGVLLAFALALALAFVAKSRSDVVVDTIKAGTGPSPTAADVLLVNYVGQLADGKEFDRGDKVVMPLKAVVPGFAEGAVKMQKGGKYKLFIPAKKGYGDKVIGPIPANSDLLFDVELLDFISDAQFRQMQMQMQQLPGMRGQRGRGGPGGAPGGMPPGAMPPGDLPPGAMPPSGPGGQ